MTNPESYPFYAENERFNWLKRIKSLVRLLLSPNIRTARAFARKVQEKYNIPDDARVFKGVYKIVLKVPTQRGEFAVSLIRVPGTSKRKREKHIKMSRLSHRWHRKYFKEFTQPMTTRIVRGGRFLIGMQKWVEENKEINSRIWPYYSPFAQENIIRLAEVDPHFKEETLRLFKNILDTFHKTNLLPDLFNPINPNIIYSEQGRYVIIDTQSVFAIPFPLLNKINPGDRISKVLLEFLKEDMESKPGRMLSDSSLEELNTFENVFVHSMPVTLEVVAFMESFVNMFSEDKK